MEALGIPLPDSLPDFALRTLVILVGTFVSLWLVSRLGRQLDKWARSQGALAPSEGEKRLRTAGNILRYSLSMVIVTVAVGMLMKEFGIDLVPLLAGASFLGLILGLGAQNLVKDYLGGFFMLVENQYAVGDWIEIGPVNGRVEKITLRVTQLRDLHGKVHFVPNGDVRLVSNLTKEWARAVLDIGVAYKEDIDGVIEVLETLAGEMDADEVWGPMLIEPTKVMGVQGLDDSAVTIRVAFTTLPEKQWEVARAYRRRVKNRFDAEGIEIPFPHRTLYIRETDSSTVAGDATPDAEDTES